MKYNIITDIDSISCEKWSDFVANHPKSSVFQTPEMFFVYKKTKNYEPFVYVVEDNNKNYVGVLLACIIKEGDGIVGYFTSRSIIHGGPIIKDDNVDICNLLLDAYDKEISKKAIYSQFRNQHNLLGMNEVFLDNRYIFESHLNFIISLREPENVIWNRIGKSRRSHIKKSLTSGLSFEVYEREQLDERIIDKGYNIISEVYRRAHLPLASVEIFYEMLRTNFLVMFVIKDSNDIIGVRFGLCYNNSLYGWYAGSYSQYYALFPNDLLIWETLKWAANKGLYFFDYGGAGSPNKKYGVRKFKSQLGGELVNYGRYEKIHKKILMGIGIFGMKLLKVIKK